MKRLRTWPDANEAMRLTRAGHLADVATLLRQELHKLAPRRNEVSPADRSAPQRSTDAVERKTGPDTWANAMETTLRGFAPHASHRSQTELPDTARRSAGWTEALGRGLRELDALGQAAPGQRFPNGLGMGEAAAPSVPDGARFVTEVCGGGPDRRTYKLYIPSRYDGSTMPLLVMLHGCTQTPDDFALGTRMNHLAEKAGVLVAYPEQTASANPQRCWNWFNPADQTRDQGEPALLAGITRQIMRDYAVDAARVYVAGLSAGGAEAAILGANYPDLYAAVGVHSGLACGAARDMPSAFAAMRQGARPINASAARPLAQTRFVPTIVFHADRDPTVHPLNGEQVITQAAATTGALHPTIQRGQVSGGRAYTRTSYSDAAGRGMLEQWVVHGGGHAWSGGDHSGSYTDPAGPDASREMLRFFLEHPKVTSAP